MSRTNVIITLWLLIILITGVYCAYYNQSFKDIQAEQTLYGQGFALARVQQLDQDCQG